MKDTTFYFLNEKRRAKCIESILRCSEEFPGQHQIPKFERTCRKFIALFATYGVR